MSEANAPKSGRSPADLVAAARTRIPTAEAEFLLMHLLGLKRHEIYLGREPVPPAAVQSFLSLVDRARRGEPAQYLVHAAPFLDFSVYVDPRVLIPRPETEELVARCCKKVANPGLILDYGTGSGCIAIALARAFVRARVVGVDVSLGALEVARMNVENLGVSGRVELVRAASLREPFFDSLEGRVDLLASNPPYVPTDRLGRLESRVRDYEPEVGLDGGADGASILAMLVERGPTLLAPDGLMALEIEPSQAGALLAARPLGTVENDLALRPRYFFLRGAWRQ